MKKLLLLSILLVGCTCPKYTYIPFKTYYSQPPNPPTTWPQPIELEDIDGSGIYVYTNGQFWYSGPRDMPNKGWIPIPCNDYRTWYYPLPGQIWSARVIYVEK
jgi:hypothetical protein